MDARKGGFSEDKVSVRMCNFSREIDVFIIAGQ